MPGTAGPWTSNPTGGQQPSAPPARAIAITSTGTGTARIAGRAGPGCSATPMACRTAVSWWTRSSNASAPAAVRSSKPRTPATRPASDCGNGRRGGRPAPDRRRARTPLRPPRRPHLTAGPADKRRTRCGHPPAGMTGRKTPQHHTGHTEPIRTPALRHSIDGNHPELREGQEDSALTAVRRGYETCGAYQTRRRRSGRYALIFLTGRRLGRFVDGWVALAALMSAAMAGSRRSLSRQRLRFGPMVPTGIPGLALISA